ncbi:lantibiotic dehydratase [Pedobacter sp. JY14-1]|uniref:lantibiotic dehydratase n=1 Tax=Pedobacter sp. JY14-1 TaxID=3034151 RepID=UPI0023E14297|nr:lantibiotic dehydratase [Pedobacter sp. JY14-1]
MKKNEIFSRVMLRSSGLSNDFYKSQFEHLRGLDIKVKDCLALQRDYLDYQNNLLAEMEFLISKLNGKSKTELISLKRSLHDSKFKNLKLGHLTIESQKRILLAHQKYNNLKKIEKQLTTTISVVATFEENSLLKYSRQSMEMQKSLLIASPTLLESIAKFPDLKIKKQRQTLYGITKYFARMAYKTSPFSYFTTTHLVAIEDLTEVKPQYEIEFTSVYSLNRAKFLHLMHLMKRSKFFRKSMLVELNSTVRKDKGKYTYYHTSNNRDYFNDMQRNPLLDHLFKRLAYNPVSFNNLIDELNQTFSSTAQNESLTDLVMHLIDNNYLVLNHGLNVLNTDFLKHFENFVLQCVQGEDHLLLKENFDLLKSNLVSKEKIGQDSGPSSLRISKIKSAIDALFTRICKLSSDGIENDEMIEYFLAHKHENLENLIFEDVYSNHSIELDQKAFNDSLSEIMNLLKEIAFLDLRQDDQYNFFNIIKSLFPRKKTINLLDAYRAYSNYTIANPEYDRTFNVRMLGAAMNEIARDSLAVDLENFQVPWRVQLDDALIKKFRNLKPLWTKPEDNKRESKSVFMQYYKSDGESYFVLNGFAIGYGKWFSRFLNHDSTENTKLLINFNSSQTSKDYLNIENVDATCGNANIHPLLFDREICIPGGIQSSSTIDTRVSLKDLSIKIGESNLKLYHEPTGKFINAFDCGFYSIMGRSLLFRILDYFNPVTNISLSYFTDSLLLHYDYMEHFCHVNQNRIRFKRFPRLTFKNIVLEREVWTIYTIDILALLSSPNPIIDMAGLREKIGLPTEVFVILSEIKHEGQESTSNSKDYYKPMYINLTSPLFVSYLGKMLRNSKSEFVNITEMLPNNDDTIACSLNNSTEILTQFAY